MAASVADRRPLIAFLEVEQKYERHLAILLRQASVSAARDIANLAGKNGIGAAIRSSQLSAVKIAVDRSLVELWKRIEDDIAIGRMDAAEAAINVGSVYEDVLLRSVVDPAVRKQLVSSAIAQARATVDVVTARMSGLSSMPLSARVYNTSALSRGIVDRQINLALAKGSSARELAKTVRHLIRPDVPGGVSYAAQRLGRTELNNAFHATQVKQANDSPFIQTLLWRLSGSHPRTDICNELASDVRFSGGDNGEYKPDDIPGKPHPQCLCYIVPQVMGEQEFTTRFLKGDFDTYLDSA